MMTMGGMMTMNELFGDVIYSYSRAQAIKDGELVDVTEIARRSMPGIPHTVMTRSVYAEAKEVAETQSLLGAEIDRVVTRIVQIGWSDLSYKYHLDKILDGESERVDFDVELKTGPMEYSVHYGPGEDAAP